jgi:hypothetical protein
VYQSRAFQHADVLGDGVERNGEIACDLGDPGIGVRKPRQDGAPRRVAERVEHLVQPGRSIFTHMDEYTNTPAALSIFRGRIGYRSSSILTGQ